MYEQYVKKTGTGQPALMNKVILYIILILYLLIRFRSNELYSTDFVRVYNFCQMNHAEFF